MTREVIRFIVDLAIEDGKIDSFESIAEAMSAGSRNEPGCQGYAWFLSSDRKRCRLLETYTDANAVVAHLTGPIVRELVPKLLGVSKLSGFEVYGDPDPEASEMLAGFGAQIFKPWQGF